MANPKKNKICGSTLAARLSKFTGFSRRECSKLISSLGIVVSDALGAGEQIEFPNFGILSSPLRFNTFRPFGKKGQRIPRVWVRSCKQLRKRLRVAASMKQAEANGV